MSKSFAWCKDKTKIVTFGKQVMTIHLKLSIGFEW